MLSTSRDNMEITVLGTGSSSHQMVSYVLRKFLTDAGIPFELVEETDIASFLKRGLTSVPCIYIDGEYLSVFSNGDFNKSLRKAIKHILKKQNFGEMDKIIVPVDFSDVSTNAFMYGHRLATDLGAVVKALHVYLPTSKELYESTVVEVDFVEMRRGLLTNFVNEFDKDWAGDIMTTSIIDGEFRTGFPGEEILDSIEDNAAEMVIMGSTGDSGAIKKWFGSVSTKIMNEASCPVLLIPEKARYTGVNNILYAYDDIELDKTLIDQLAEFSLKLDATLHFVHVDDKEQPNPGYYLKELFQDKFPDHKIEISSMYNPEITAAIEEYSKLNSIDIIAIGTRNRPFFDRIFHKSMTREMAMHSELPILILKHEVE
ncbi:MAG: universal stress protein [Bacteroidota bacterium]